MEILGSLFLVLALLLAVALFISRPFFRRDFVGTETSLEGDPLEHRLSSLLAERDRLLTALQELEFDYTLGKIPAEDYPLQRAELLKKGSSILRTIDSLKPGTETTQTAEDRIEAAIASRRADAVRDAPAQQAVVLQPAMSTAQNVGTASKDDLENLISSRRRQRQEKTSGFCPRCGRPVLKSDKFCSKCGTTL